jgi:hypothetical protein
MTSFTTIMKVSELMRYREFDRELNPAPVLLGFKTYSVDEVTEWLKEQDILSITPLQLCVVDDSALLTDGNHRLLAAHKLGKEFIPVSVRYIESKDKFQKMYSECTVNRLKQII